MFLFWVFEKGAKYEMGKKKKEALIAMKYKNLN